MALANSAEEPLPVRTISKAIGDWIARLGTVWVEGQVAQLSRKSGMSTAFLTLRDPVADVSVSATVPVRLLEQSDIDIASGSLVVVQAKPNWYHPRGSVSLQVRDIRIRGEGELWAQIERRKKVLAAEGLFRPDRKTAPPFLPHRVGLICGRSSAAEHDVLQNTRRRWPGVAFEVRNVPVQGHNTVTAIRQALAELDRLDGVDVIVIARGGGSVEDLLPFSDEGLIRAVVATRTPVVSAIGHETDTPLLDLAADVRASTPTDAATCIVPDVTEELDRISHGRHLLRTRVQQRLSHEALLIDRLRSSPPLRDPADFFIRSHLEVAYSIRGAARELLHQRIREADHSLHGETSRLRALSPAATLARGYAIVQTEDGEVVTNAAAVTTDQSLNIRLDRGRLTVQVTVTEPDQAAGVPTPAAPSTPTTPDE